MLRLVTRRVAIGIPLILVVVGLVLAFIDLAPGDPAQMLAGDNPTEARVAEIRETLRLDQSLPSRYLSWVGDAVRGDLGVSIRSGQEVTTQIAKRIGVTGSLVLAATVFAIALGGLAGIVAGRRVGGVVDRVITVVASVAIAIPPFWLGMLLVVSFAIHRSWFPAIGYDSPSEGIGEWARSLVLPGIALGAFPAAELAMQLRTSLASALDEAYVLAADAKGLTRRAVVMQHALKNALIPVVTVFGIRLSQMLGGAVTIETVFVLPGLGALTVESVMQRDIPVVLGVVALSSIVVVVINLLVDISYGLLNPKLRS